MLVDIGFGNVVVLSRIVAIISPNSAPIKRMRDGAHKDKLLVDASQGRKTRSVIITDSNHVILSTVTIETIVRRIEERRDN